MLATGLAIGASQSVSCIGTAAPPYSNPKREGLPSATASPLHERELTMAEFDRPTIAAGAGSAAVVDQGLRSYLLRVYNYMGLGLVVTGLVAYFAYAAATTSDQAQAATD